MSEARAARAAQAGPGPRGRVQGALGARELLLNLFLKFYLADLIVIGEREKYE